MEPLKLKYAIATKALQSLAASLEKFAAHAEFPPYSSLTSKEFEELLRDSVIKRFEYSVDTVWKYVKEYLRNKFGVERNSPKPILRECLKNGLLSEEETELGLTMIDDRNETVHAYKGDVATTVSAAIPNYYKLLKQLLTVTQP